MDHLEDILADECVRQNVNPSPEEFRQMLTEAIGRLDSQRMISLPQGTISVRDFVRCFASDGSPKEPQKPSGNLTEDMKREIAETRRSRALPSDWTTVRERMAGKTAEMMDAIAVDRKGTVR